MKKFLVRVLLAMVVSLMVSAPAMAWYTIKSQTQVFPAGETPPLSYQIVVKDGNGELASGIMVVGAFFEHLGDDGPLGVVQKEVTNKNGVVTFHVPANQPANTFKYFSTYVGKDSASFHHELFYWTGDRSLYAKVDFLEEGEVPLGETISCVVRNAWGEPLPETAVEIVTGVDAVTSRIEVTDGLGVAKFHLKESLSGRVNLKVQVVRFAFIYAETTIWWGDQAIKPSSPADKNGIVAETSYEDEGLPVFSFSVGKTYNAVFTLYDEKGDPVVGKSLSVLFPNWKGVTDGKGRVTVPLPASSFQGYDLSSIWVTDNPEISLDFKIVYQ